MIPNVLSIAGSDPSGGAGIQADIKAISANGAFAMAALTALTAQNTQGVSAVHLIPSDFVQSQINAVFDDIHVDAVKIGMIANKEIALVVANTLARQNVPVVLDPVMVAKGGARLLDDNAIKVIRESLLPIATILTPNLPEAAWLLETDVATSRIEMEEQGHALCALGAKSVLMKGGHLNTSDSPDCLVTANSVTWFESPRVKTPNTHGTGCTLSSALAAQLARTGNIKTALTAAKLYVSAAIRNAEKLNVGLGHGPTHHFANIYPFIKDTAQ